MSYLIYQNAQIHYIRFGTGSQTLVALHGYGDSAALYRALEPSLGKRYTIYSIDLPYHGRTRWAATRLFGVADIAGIVAAVCEAESVGRFALMGYSMGGRFAMCIAPDFADRLDALFVIAASGIKIHPIFNALTVPAWIIRLLSFNIRYPTLLFAAMRMARWLRLLPKSVYRFNRKLLATERRRQRMHYTWLSIRQFIVDVPQLQQCLNQQPTPVYLLFGDRDEIVPAWVGRFFAKGLHQAQFRLVSGNHFLVNAALNPVLDDLLNEA